MKSVWSTILEELSSAAQEAVPGSTVPAWEIPPDTQLGDAALPCFTLAKELGVSPKDIAERIAEQLSAHPLVMSATATGPYANVVLDTGEVARRVFEAVAGEEHGSEDTPSNSPPCFAQTPSNSPFKKGENRSRTAADSEARRVGGRDVVLVEMIAPNTNKPLHIGHLRNAFIGESVARLLEAQGHDVHRVNVVNDRGVHIMKSMLAYQRWGNGETPESAGMKGDHFVGKWYVRFAQENKKQEGEQETGDKKQETVDKTPTLLEGEIQEMLRSWEQGDPEIRALWERMTGWALDGLYETYRRIGIAFEKEYFEGTMYERGREIVEKQLECGVFQKAENGNIVVPLEDVGLSDKVVLRSDGTTVYATQDIALVEAKYNDYQFDRSIYVVGSEQDYYFKQLFEIFKRMELPYAGRCTHRSYGIVNLPEGRMKSREGTVVDADDLLDELERLAMAEIEQRADIVPGEPDFGTTEPPIIVDEDASERAHAIALAAIRFFMLHVTPEAVVTFNPNESIAFTGKTGPYLQYMHARMCSIARKSTEKERVNAEAVDASLLREPAEKQLLVRIARFPDVVAEAAERLDPSVLAQFLYDLARTFADFYRDVPVNQAEGDLRTVRLALLHATRQVFARGLTLLGIEPIERM
ncbi:MAG: arginine--tRNA ligase [Candidatus Uhrbacteria bacterium]